MSYLEIPSVFDNFTYCAAMNNCGGNQALAFKTNTDLIIYTGNSLSCSSVAKCDTVSTILETFNDAICPETITATIINEFINNSELADILCETILKKCIDCDALENCITCEVILECTTTTSTTTVIPPCSCLTFSNSSDIPKTILITPCNLIDGPFVTVPPGQNTISVCGSNPIPDNFPSTVTWEVGGPCVPVNGYYVCSDDCCNYTVTRTVDPVYINFLNCFGYRDYLEPEPDTTVSFCAIEDQVFVFGGEAVKESCDCVPECECYEVDNVDVGGAVIRWTSCNGVDTGEYVKAGEIFPLCAIPGTAQIMSGVCTLTPKRTPCDINTDCWEEVILDGTDLLGVTRINQVTSTSRFAVEWRPGVVTLHNAGTIQPTYTYASIYTGPVKIKAPRITAITRLDLYLAWNVPAPSTRSLILVGSELAKLVNLYFLDIGFTTNTQLIANTLDVPSGMIDLAVYKGNLSGDVGNLPDTITSLNVYGVSTIGGDISGLPLSLIDCYIYGANTIDGDLDDLPVALSPILKNIEILGQNEIAGDIDNFTGYSVIQTIRIEGLNTVTGDISSISGLTTLIRFNILGKNRILGNLSSLVALTSLQTFYVDNDDTYLIPGVVGNEITGNISNIPSSVKTFILGKYNTVDGNLSSVPSGIQTFDVRQVFGGGGASGITGSLSSITSRLSLNLFRLEGKHNVSGNITDLPANLTIFVLGTPYSTISGDLSDLPSSIINFKLEGLTGATTLTYTTPRTWATNMRAVDMLLTGSGVPDLVGLDDLIIDLAATTWVPNSTSGIYGLRAKGTPSATPAVTAAINTLQAIPINTYFY
jgi:hypothetical protein